MHTTLKLDQMLPPAAKKLIRRQHRQRGVPGIVLRRRWSGSQCATCFGWSASGGAEMLMRMSIYAPAAQQKSVRYIGWEWHHSIRLQE